MGTLTLNDGTILENSYLTYGLDNVILYVGNGMNIGQLAQVLTAERLSEITYVDGDSRKVFTGFVNIIGMQRGVNYVSVVLRQ